MSTRYAALLSTRLKVLEQSGQTKPDNPRIEAHTDPAERLRTNTLNQDRSDRHSDHDAWQDVGDEPQALERIQAGVVVRDRREGRFSQTDEAERGPEVLLGQALIAQHHRERRTRDRCHRVQQTDTAAEDESDRSLGPDGPPVARGLNEDQRQKNDESAELQPTGIDPRHERGAEQHTGREADDDGEDAAPDAGERGPVDPEDVGVQHDLDGHQRRVQHPVGQEQERQRNGDRRKPVPQRAVDDSGTEGDGDEGDLVRVHGAPKRKFLCLGLLKSTPNSQGR